ncbi:MAG: DNA mismatch repair endonuclease MutL [Clostridia bacterium]
MKLNEDGIDYICISDNGIGFAKDDVEMAFERHATSKIRKEEDLLKITSMGFRGEALASIAAISKVTLTTKNINENIGTRIIIEAGKKIYYEPAAFITGSKIEVRNVFFNVPARYKFLKKDFTEAGYIEDVVMRISLANPRSFY